MKPGRSETPRIVIVAGPNGAGKTTFAEEFLPREAGCPDFINADLIARGLSPFAPERAAFEAGKIMLTQIAARVRARRSFAFETTLSSLSYARQIPCWRADGYRVGIIFLSLPSAELALARIRARVAQGGHDVADAVVRRRFLRGTENFSRFYRKIVDDWVRYDNSGIVPRLIDSGGDP